MTLDAVRRKLVDDMSEVGEVCVWGVGARVHVCVTRVLITSCLITAQEEENTHSTSELHFAV